MICMGVDRTAQFLGFRSTCIGYGTGGSIDNSSCACRVRPALASIPGSFILKKESKKPTPFLAVSPAQPAAKDTCSSNEIETPIPLTNHSSSHWLYDTLEPELGDSRLAFMSEVFLGPPPRIYNSTSLSARCGFRIQLVA